MLPVEYPDGRKYDVSQYQCLACAAVEAVRRDWNKAHEDDPEPKRGQVSPTDARTFIATPHTEEDARG